MARTVGTGERIPFIAGNWKMNLDHLQAIAFVQKLAWTLSDARHDYAFTEVAVFPPFTDLRSVQTLISADKLDLGFGAQDVSSHPRGAFTGEVSAEFLKALDVQYVIIGHSERRQYHHESDELLAEKVAITLANGMVPVICVGETAEDLELYGPSAVPVSQLHAALALAGGAKDIVVAYEPVWAIGSGQAATPEQAEQVAEQLRFVIAEVLGGEVADATRILYGGSVKSTNIASFLRQPNVDGALVGGASLDISEFASIAQFRKHVGT
ncbi:MAG TPA: triose-phosphate isomerase [Galbitalea sp.]|jgi:triosephosphate isomerase|nr:triose-phosphate isomerase [Galbitalea sp.]